MQLSLAFVLDWTTFGNKEKLYFLLQVVFSILDFFFFFCCCWIKDKACV